MIDMLPGINSSNSALNAERIRLEVIAQNIANANSTRGPNGLPYQRQQVVFQTVLDQNLKNQASGGAIQTLQVARIEKDHRAPRLNFNPGHPDADSIGMVATPDINIHEEMADLLTASRAFEANLAVVKNARTMAMQTMAIGKR